MLPTEAFADAVAFLRLFDMKALLITNAICSSHAVKASTVIRWEEFPSFRFEISKRMIYVSRACPEEEGSWPCFSVVTRLAFADENEMREFVTAAFPNCIVEDFIISGFSPAGNDVWDAVRRVADCVVVKRALGLPHCMSPDDSLSLVGRFRKVKVSYFCNTDQLPFECVRISIHDRGGEG